MFQSTVAKPIQLLVGVFPVVATVATPTPCARWLMKYLAAGRYFCPWARWFPPAGAPDVPGGGPPPSCRPVDFTSSAACSGRRTGGGATTLVSDPMPRPHLILRLWRRFSPNGMDSGKGIRVRAGRRREGQETMKHARHDERALCRNQKEMKCSRAQEELAYVADIERYRILRCA